MNFKIKTCLLTYACIWDRLRRNNFFIDGTWQIWSPILPILDSGPITFMTFQKITVWCKKRIRLICFNCTFSNYRIRANKGRGFYSEISFPVQQNGTFQISSISAGRNCRKFTQIHLFWVTIWVRLLFKSVLSWRGYGIEKIITKLTSSVNQMFY